MKRINLILMTLALCLFGACDEGLDDLEGTYDMDIYNFTSASVGETEYISSSLKVLNVVLSDESGNSMDIDFGSSAYVLPEATYNYSSDISAAKQYNGVLNGSTSFSGDIDVVLVDSVYYFTGLLSYSSGETFKMTYKGVITFEEGEDEGSELTELTQLVSASSNVASGTNSVSLILATAGVEATYYADYYSWYYGGTGYYLAVDFYSEDGYLYEGTYSPSSSGTPEAGCYVIGYDPGDIYGWGYSFTDWGTCWWTVDNGTTTAEKITSGDITVTKSGSTYTITVDNTICYAQYKGAIDALNPSGDADDGSSSVELTNAFNVANNNSYGWGNTINVMIADANISAEYSWTSYSWEITGTGNYISFDIYTTSTDLALPTGTLNIVDSASAAEGDVIAGYTAEYSGYEYLSGSIWYTVEDSVASGEAITDGTVTITANSDGTYTIDIASSVANATYTGAITFTY